MAILPESPTVKHWRHILNAKLLNHWSWGCFVSVFDATGPADHCMVIPTKPLQFSGIWPSHNIWQQWHCHSPYPNIAYRIGCRKWPPHQAWCHHHPLQSQFCHRWAEPSHYTGADIDWVGYQSLSDATALLVDPQHALWAQGGVFANTTTADITWATFQICRTPWPTPETRNLIFFMLTRIPLLSMPAFHTLSLQLHSSWVPKMSTNHQHTEHPMAHQCGTPAKAHSAPGWRAVG